MLLPRFVFCSVLVWLLLVTALCGSVVWRVTLSPTCLTSPHLSNTPLIQKPPQTRSKCISTHYIHTRAESPHFNLSFLTIFSFFNLPLLRTFLLLCSPPFSPPFPSSATCTITRIVCRNYNFTMPSPLFIYEVAGTPWHVIVTDDAGHFYFNSVTKLSVWQLGETGDLHLAELINYDELAILFAKARGLKVGEKPERSEGHAGGNRKQYEGDQTQTEVGKVEDEIYEDEIEVGETEQRETNEKDEDAQVSGKKLTQDAMELLRSVMAEHNVEVEEEEGDGEETQKEHSEERDGSVSGKEGDAGLALGYSSEDLDDSGLEQSEKSDLEHDLDVNAGLDLGIEESGFSQDELDRESEKGENQKDEGEEKVSEVGEVNEVNEDGNVNQPNFIDSNDSDNDVRDGRSTSKNSDAVEVHSEEATATDVGDTAEPGEALTLDLSGEASLSPQDILNYKKLLSEHKDSISLYDPWFMVAEELVPHLATRPEFYAVPETAREEIYNSWVSEQVLDQTKQKYPTNELLFYQYLQMHKKEVKKLYFGEFCSKHPDLLTFLQAHPLPNAEGLYRKLRVELVDFSEYERKHKKQNPATNLKVAHVQKFLARSTLGVAVSRCGNSGAFDQWISLLNEGKVPESVAHDPANFVLGDEKRLKCYEEAMADR